MIRPEAASSASATPRFGCTSRKLPSWARKSSRAICTITCRTIAPTSTRSAVLSSRPPLVKVSRSAMIAMVQKSSSRSLNSWMTGDSNPASSGPTNSPKPTATIQSPLRLSGRRRQAISPHPANAPAIAPTTARCFICGPPSMTGSTTVTTTAVTVIAHSANQNVGPCVGPSRRRRTSALPGRCTSVARPVATIPSSLPLLEPDSTPWPAKRALLDHRWTTACAARLLLRRHGSRVRLHGPRLDAEVAQRPVVPRRRMQIGAEGGTHDGRQRGPDAAQSECPDPHRRPRNMLPADRFSEDALEHFHRLLSRQRVRAPELDQSRWIIGEREADDGSGDVVDGDIARRRLALAEDHHFAFRPVELRHRREPDLLKLIRSQDDLAQGRAGETVLGRDLRETERGLRHRSQPNARCRDEHEARHARTLSRRDERAVTGDVDAAEIRVPVTGKGTRDDRDRRDDHLSPCDGPPQRLGIAKVTRGQLHAALGQVADLGVRPHERTDRRPGGT